MQLSREAADVLNQQFATSANATCHASMQREAVQRRVWQPIIQAYKKHALVGCINHDDSGSADVSGALQQPLTVTVTNIDSI